MMVKETRITYEPTDVVALVIVCKHCGTETRVRVGTEDKMLPKCHQCGRYWKEPNTVSHADELERLLGCLRNHANKAYFVKLEVTGDE